MPDQNIDNSVLEAMLNELLVLAYMKLRDQGKTRETLLPDLLRELDLYRSGAFHRGWNEKVSDFINNPRPVDEFLSKVNQVLSSAGARVSQPQLKVCDGG
jgi:hypothetical protein